MTVLVCGDVLAARLAMAATGEKIAVLKDATILVVSADGEKLGALSTDPRPKSDLRWLADGQRLSYTVRDENGAKETRVAWLPHPSSRQRQAATACPRPRLSIVGQASPPDRWWSSV